jgi:hypothetical protein
LECGDATLEQLEIQKVVFVVHLGTLDVAPVPGMLRDQVIIEVYVDERVRRRLYTQGGRGVKQKVMRKTLQSNHSKGWFSKHPSTMADPATSYSQVTLRSAGVLRRKGSRMQKALAAEIHNQK